MLRRSQGAASGINPEMIFCDVPRERPNTRRGFFNFPSGKPSVQQKPQILESISNPPKMTRSDAELLAEAGKEIEKILRVMGGHYIEWSNLETECSFLSCLARVDSAEDFQNQIIALFRIMDHHIDSIQYYLTYYLMSTIRAIEINFPMTSAGTAAVQDRNSGYPTLEATCLNYWNSKTSNARAMTNRAKDVLPDIPDDRARVERLDKIVPGYQRRYEDVVMMCNAPVDKRDNAEFKQEFKQLMEEVTARIQGRAPRA